MKITRLIAFVICGVCLMSLASVHAQGLTPEERQKIIEEERLRQQIRGQDQCIRDCLRWVGTSVSQRRNQEALDACRQNCGN
jgi:hypothetical protein